MTELLGNRYRIEKIIGKGGMATVYLAYDTILNREVAIKVLKDEMSSDPLAIERFNREARATARLVHPNIVEIYDINDEGDKHYIVMEYIKGYTLKKLIEVRGAIPVKESVWMIKQLSLALLEAHTNGILHRDIKSQNVLIKPDGTVKMADFGIAQANDDIQITKQDTILGSVHYLAPELTKGKPASMQSDIYSLGIVFYELLVGDVPFKGDSAVAVALKHINTRIPSLRKINDAIPQSVENIIIKATAKNPKNRYENIALMLKDLNECLKPEHLHDKKIVLNENIEGTQTMEIVGALKNREMDGRKKGIFSKGLGIVGLIALSLVCVFALVAVLYLSGFIHFGKESKLTIVPDVVGMSITDAKDVLDEATLSIDYDNIERVMTDDKPIDVIIEIEPLEGEEVNKYSKIKLVVSSGIYKKMPSYIGLSIEEVKDMLKDTKIIAKYDYVESEYESGTILTQSLKEGYKYDENSLTEITFEVSGKSEPIYIENLSHRNVDEVFEELTEKGAVVEKILLSDDELNSEILKEYAENTVVKYSPYEGSTIEEGATVKLYYYLKEGN